MAFVGNEVTGSLAAVAQAATASCAPWDGAVVQITGTFVATVVFEASIDGGTTWVSAAGGTTAAPGTVTVVSASAVGHWLFNISPYTMFRVRCSAWTSGAAVVRISFSDTL